MWIKINLKYWYKINDFIILWEDATFLSWERKLLREKVKCICWNILFVRKDHLLSWRSKNCWCKKKEKIKEVWKRNKTHGMDWTKIYSVYASLKQRCNNLNNKNYWGRWIKCEWNTFEEFYKDMWDSYKEWLSLDRIDVNWNYCKENCRWATWKVQQNNRRNNRLIEYKWEIKTLSQLEELWFWKRIVWDRISNGWSIDRAIEQSPRKHLKR